MTSKLALFALFYWFFLFLTCFLGGKLGLYHIPMIFSSETSANHSNLKPVRITQIRLSCQILPEFASKKIEHQNKSDYKCLLFIE